MHRDRLRNTALQIGIVSWSAHECEQAGNTQHTMLPAMIDWIESSKEAMSEFPAQLREKVNVHRYPPPTLRSVRFG